MCIIDVQSLALLSQIISLHRNTLEMSKYYNEYNLIKYHTCITRSEQYTIIKINSGISNKYPTLDKDINLLYLFI